MKKLIKETNRLIYKEHSDITNTLIKEPQNKVKIPIFKEYLYNIELGDSFFDSLKKDYKNFEEWYIRKMQDGFMAYITRDNFGNLGSFLMLKVEDEQEDYSNFEIPFKKGIRLKVATFKVASIGNKIGKRYMNIIINEAKK